MYENTFTRLAEDETREVLEFINPHIHGIRYDPETAVVMVSDISFYSGYKFFDIAEYSLVPPARRFVVSNGENVVVLDWTNGPIYGLNETVPVTLDEMNVSDYVRFFFTYVRGRHGRFLITESVDDVNWKEDPPPAARKAIGKMLVPLTLIGRDDKGNIILTACMMFRDSLFKAKVTVEPNGLVTLSDEELLIEEMPVLDDTFAQ